jgi:hypothetical protein
MKNGHVVLNAQGGKHDRELDPPFQQARLPDDLRGKAVVRQAVTGKDWQLLTPHQCVDSVDRRHTCLNKLPRVLPCVRVDRKPVDVAAVR